MKYKQGEHLKLEEKDKKIMLIGLVIGVITNIFIEKTMDLIIMIGIIYFMHKYIDRILLNVKILEDYSKVVMIFMFVLAFSQIPFIEKDKKNKSYPVIASVFLIGSSIFGSITFNTYYIDLESRIFMNFAENGLYVDNEI